MMYSPKKPLGVSTFQPSNLLLPAMVFCQHSAVQLYMTIFSARSNLVSHISAYQLFVAAAATKYRHDDEIFFLILNFSYHMFKKLYFLGLPDNQRLSKYFQ
jgi:hypothetical protein